MGRRAKWRGGATDPIDVDQRLPLARRHPFGGRPAARSLREERCSRRHGSKSSDVERDIPCGLTEHLLAIGRIFNHGHDRDSIVGVAVSIDQNRRKPFGRQLARERRGIECRRGLLPAYLLIRQRRIAPPDRTRHQIELEVIGIDRIPRDSLVIEIGAERQLEDHGTGRQTGFETADKTSESQTSAAMPACDTFNGTAAAACWSASPTAATTTAAAIRRERVLNHESNASASATSEKKTMNGEMRL